MDEMIEQICNVYQYREATGGADAHRMSELKKSKKARREGGCEEEESRLWQWHCTPHSLHLGSAPTAANRSPPQSTAARQLL